MFLFNKYFIILTLISVHNICILECRRVKRVVGGIELSCGTQIRVASLRNTTNHHLCGATVLSPNHAVTAAHCVSHDPGNYQLQLNNYCIYGNQTLPRASVLEIINHPLYNELSRAHDIAVLRIQFDSHDITWLNETVLPNSSFGISGDCIVYGYGYKEIGVEETSERLLAAKLRLVSLDECTMLLGAYVAPEYDSGMLCAVGDGTDTCQGDSGGPLMCGDEFQGVCSYGLSCGVKNMPGVYLSIGPHLEWLRSIIENNIQGDQGAEVTMEIIAYIR